MSFRGDGMKNNPYQNIIDEMTAKRLFEPKRKMYEQLFKEADNEK